MAITSLDRLLARQRASSLGFTAPISQSPTPSLQSMNISQTENINEPFNPDDPLFRTIAAPGGDDEGERDPGGAGLRPPTFEPPEVSDPTFPEDGGGLREPPEWFDPPKRPPVTPFEPPWTPTTPESIDVPLWTEPEGGGGNGDGAGKTGEGEETGTGGTGTRGDTDDLPYFGDWFSRFGQFNEYPSLSSLLPNTIIAEKYRDLFPQYDPFREYMSQRSYREDKGELSRNLMELLRQSQGLESKQDFATSFLGKKGMRLGRQEAEERRDVLDLGLRKDIYGFRRGYADEVFNRLAQIIEGGGEPLLKTKGDEEGGATSWSELKNITGWGYMSDDSPYVQWLVNEHGFTPQVYSTLSRDEQLQWFQEYYNTQGSR